MIIYLLAVLASLHVACAARTTGEVDGRSDAEVPDAAEGDECRDVIGDASDLQVSDAMTRSDARTSRIGTLAWVVDVESPILGQPAASLDGVFLVTQGLDRVHALPTIRVHKILLDGSVKWQTDVLGQSSKAAISVAKDGRIVVVEPESGLLKLGRIHSFSGTGGHEWSEQVARAVLSRHPAITDYGIYYVTSQGVEALSREGVPLWNSPIPVLQHLSAGMQPLVLGDDLFVNASPSHITRLDVSTGEVRSTIVLNEWVFGCGPVPIRESDLLLGGGTATAQVSQRGAIRWEHTNLAKGACPTTSAEGLVFRGGNSINCLSEGEILWTHYTEGAYESPTLLANGDMAYLVRLGSHHLALSGSNGGEPERYWLHEVPSPIPWTVTSGGLLVYVSDTRAVAVHLPSGPATGGWPSVNGDPGNTRARP